MAYAIQITIMNQTWQHSLSAEEDHGRCRRGEPVEMFVATEPFPDDITTIKSARELNAFYWVEVTNIPDNIPFQAYVDWLMPQHEAVSHGEVEYSYLTASPSIGETLTSQRTEVAGEINQADNNSGNGLMFTGDPDAFERGEWIEQDNDNTKSARISNRDTDPDGNEWFILGAAEGGGFDAGQGFTGQTSGGQGITVENRAVHAGRMRLINVTGQGDGEPDQITLSPSGATGWVMQGKFTAIARRKRLLPFTHANTPQQIRDDFQNKFWTRVTHNQLRSLIRRQPDDIIPHNDANIMDSETLDDDVNGPQRK